MAEETEPEETEPERPLAGQPPSDGELYWLASYPKSGNTWSRVLLTNYLRDGDEPADINSLDGGPIASARVTFDDHVGIEASDLTQDEIERLRPGVYEHMSKDIAKYRDEHPDDEIEPHVLKVHDAYTMTDRGVPLMSKAATAGAIYVLRNPLDVVESFAHHSHVSVRRITRQMNNSDYGFVDKDGRLHNQLRQRLLTWSQHVTSWVDEPGLRTLTVRYEDLSVAPEATLTKMVDFLGLTPEPERIAKAVRFSSFDRLQKQEQESGFGEKSAKAESFFRKGQAGGWRSTLAVRHAIRICQDHGEVMDRFGYEPDATLRELRGY